MIQEEEKIVCGSLNSLYTMLKLVIIIKYRQFEHIQPYCLIKIIDNIIGMGPVSV